MSFALPAGMRAAVAIGVLAGSALVAFGGCVALRKFALARALLDVPNERSLHSEPVPRLGGVALCAGALFAALAAYAVSGDALLLGWIALSVPVFAVGLVDDLRPVSAKVRFALQGAVAIGFVALTGPPTQLVLAGAASEPLTFAVSPWISGPASVFWLVAVINIYNFMDGMDGLAAVQAIGASVAFAWLLGLAQPALGFVALGIAAASAGFFMQNAPKAKIFLGDAGSTVLGFSFAGFALMSAKSGQPLVAGPMALAPFLLDATFTLLRRAKRRERVWEAHRTHLYQRAVSSGLTHRAVLARYAVWVMYACIAAMSMPRANLGGMLAACISLALVLVLVRQWVWGREAQRRVAE